MQVGETGRAVGIDLVPELIKMAQDNIENDSPQLMSNYTVKLVGQWEFFLYLGYHVYCSDFVI